MAEKEIEVRIGLDVHVYNHPERAEEDVLIVVGQAMVNAFGTDCFESGKVVMRNASGKVIKYDDWAKDGNHAGHHEVLKVDDDGA